MEYKQKLIRGEVTVLGKGLVQAVISSEAKDRDGDIIRQRYWDFTEFLKHPVMLSSHDYYSLRSIIGEWQDIQVKGAKTVGNALYYIGKGNAEADWGAELAEMGKAAYSVGFRPDMSKAREMGDGGLFPTYEFRGQELLEVSHVSVPSNPDARQQLKSFTGLHPVLKDVLTEFHDVEPDADDPTEAIDEMAAKLLDMVGPQLRDMVSEALAPVWEQVEVIQTEKAAERLYIPSANVWRSGIKDGIRDAVTEALTHDD